MATQDSHADGADVTLPSVVPFDLPYVNRLSWDFGSCVVESEDATLSGRWKHTGRSWSLAAFEVTSETAVLRVRTPAGREQFYSAARRNLQSARSAIEAAPRWQPID